MSFFSKVEGTLVEASTSVNGFGFELNIENKNEYTYPINGWYYFETREEALEKLGIIEGEKIITGNNLPKFNMS